MPPQLEGAPPPEERHPGPIYWCTSAPGSPLLGKPSDFGLLTAEELDNLDRRVFCKARFFRMWDPEEVEYYCWVMDRISQGWFKLLDRQKVWDAERQSFKIWLEWTQSYRTPPRAKEGRR